MRESFVPFMKSQLRTQTVLIACGLPASYKTETTEVIARIMGYTILRTDMIRLEVLKEDDIFDEKVAASMTKRVRVYDEMFRLADELAGRGKGVILDATFITQGLRRRAAEVAARHAVPLVIQQTRCPREVSLRRIFRRTRENYESNALTEQAYANNVEKFEPVDLDDIETLHPTLDILHLIVDTGSDSTGDWTVVDRVCR